MSPLRKWLAHHLSLSCSIQIGVECPQSRQVAHLGQRILDVGREGLAACHSEPPLRWFPCFLRLANGLAFTCCGKASRTVPGHRPPSAGSVCEIAEDARVQNLGELLALLSWADVPN